MRLYHTKREFTLDEASWLNPDYYPEDFTCRMAKILNATWVTTPQWIKELWITEEQLEQLTKDVEEFAVYEYSLRHE